MRIDWLQVITSPMLAHHVLRLKHDNPHLLAHDIRNVLLAQRICDERTCPSVSAINRVLRHAALSTPLVTSAVPATSDVTAAHLRWFGARALQHPYMTSVHHMKKLDASQRTSGSWQMPVFPVAAATSTNARTDCELLPDILLSHRNDVTPNASAFSVHTRLPSLQPTEQTTCPPLQQHSSFDIIDSCDDVTPATQLNICDDVTRAETTVSDRTTVLNSDIAKQHGDTVREQTNIDERKEERQIRRSRFTNFSIDSILNS